ncbi:DNA utilization family protein [Yersinia sp. 2553 StPb PI]|uniref:DNA utilization family protein n=1 Tax=Yersinia sp. 2553 StPb PI TaxID=3117411 RepID=UPI00187D1CB4
MGPLKIVSLIIVSLAPVAYADPLLTATGRNPFQDLSAQPCDGEREKLTHWRLQGVIRGGDYSSGWILRPEGRWQKLVVGSRLLSTWQVTHIGSRQVSLQNTGLVGFCSGLSEPVVLLMH